MHNSEREHPDLPFFTGKAKGIKLTNVAETSGQSTGDATERKVSISCASGKLWPICAHKHVKKS